MIRQTALTARWLVKWRNLPMLDGATTTPRLQVNIMLLNKIAVWLLLGFGKSIGVDAQEVEAAEAL